MTTAPRQRTPAVLRRSLSALGLGLIASAAWMAWFQPLARAQAQDEAARLLEQYVRIDTSNPPGDTRKAADFLASVLEREGIPVTRYESAPGKAIVSARLAATVTPRAGKATKRSAAISAPAG